MNVYIVKLYNKKYVEITNVGPDCKMVKWYHRNYLAH